MFPRRVADLPRPGALPGQEPQPPPPDAAPSQKFARPPPCPRCELIDHQTQLQINTFQKVYKKKVEEAQYNAGRWKSEYYQMREQLYRLQQRDVLSHLPAMVAGCALGYFLATPPAKAAAGWLLARLRQAGSQIRSRLARGKPQPAASSQQTQQAPQQPLQQHTTPQQHAPTAAELQSPPPPPPSQPASMPPAPVPPPAVPAPPVPAPPPPPPAPVTPEPASSDLNG